MPDEKRKVASQEFLKRLETTGAVDFNQVGELVKQVSPQLFDPGLAQSDYIAKGYESVIHIWEIRPADIGLDQVAKLRDVTQQVKKPTR